MLRAAILLSCVFPISANAGWERSEINDEMRSTSTTMYRQGAVPIGGGGPTLNLIIFDKGDGAPSAMLGLAGASVEGCPKKDMATCDVPVRFDVGAVNEVPFGTRDSRNLVPELSVAFVGSILGSKVMYVELPVLGIKHQYKYDLSELPVKYDPNPKISILGFELGKSYPVRDLDIPVTREVGDHVCYAGKSAKNALGDAPAAKVNLCFYRGVFYQAIVTPGSKGSYDAGFRYFNSKFGQPDRDGLMPSWPKTEKVISKFVVTASYFELKKNDYTREFIVTDEAWRLLIPKLE
ncbi:hypothetical protein [Pseudomonas sp. BP7]|uniref:hypothetical protein n=2 Tax=unclassified Pseudomonas TaxID=196821 RepID=UPI001AE87CA8|nr:hypothetical protein [Pseudomonas sp. BP7]MBP2284869.1 hypothetical protein [Pseudomonas sp. BP7]MBP2290233.1 hypothetical protein [Pseudomonas sp. BP7]HDS1700950.1 hypothetical protein [Pseudomonas putida]